MLTGMFIKNVALEYFEFSFDINTHVFLFLYTPIKTMTCPKADFNFFH